MTPRSRPRLALRLFVAMGTVIAVGGLTLGLTVKLVAPGLFHQHLSRFGFMSPDVTQHAEQAFSSSFAIAIALAMVTSLVAAAVVSWLLVLRVARPVEELARAAETVARGDYRIEVPDEPFSAELDLLATSFRQMADRLAATDATRTRLLADLAHELRTPLATLEAYIDGLEDGVVRVDADAFSTMRDQVARLRRLATDVREAAAADEHALHLELLDIDAAVVVAESVVAAQPRYQAKGVALEVVLGESSLPVHGDRGRLGQVFANLLDNALRHTPGGGRVTVTAHRDAAGVFIEVADTGEGIPAPQLDAIFERFHRVDPARSNTDGSGSGLGLTIARAIVQDHDGTLTATSAGAGKGARLVVTLPRPGGS